MRVFFVVAATTPSAALLAMVLLFVAGYLAITRAPCTVSPGTDNAGTLCGPLLADGTPAAMPSDMAVARASARVLAPSLRRIASTWCSTVRTETTSRSAIWPFCKPSFTNANTSNSRTVSPNWFLRVVERGPRGNDFTPISRSRRATIAAAGRASSPTAPPMPAAAARVGVGVGVGQAEGGLVGAPGLGPQCPGGIPAAGELQAMRANPPRPASPRPGRHGGATRPARRPGPDRASQRQPNASSVAEATPSGSDSSQAASARAAARGQADIPHRLARPSPRPRRAEADDRGPRVWPGQAPGRPGR